MNLGQLKKLIKDSGAEDSMEVMIKWEDGFKPVQEVLMGAVRHSEDVNSYPWNGDDMHIVLKISDGSHILSGGSFPYI